MLLPKACALFAVFASVSALGADIEGVVTFHRPADTYFFLETASGAAWRVQRDANEKMFLKSVGFLISRDSAHCARNREMLYYAYLPVGW